MSWRDWFKFRKQRVSSSTPIDIVPFGSAFFGPGTQFQPSKETLLAESIGIPDSATRAIANRISGLNPQVVVDKVSENGTIETETLDDHPLQQLLNNPHPNLSRSKVLRLCAQWIVTVGEAYLQKVSSGLGMPMELHPIPPTLVEPLIQKNVVIAYQLTDANGARSVVPPETMVRIYLPDPENPWRAEGYLAPAGIMADSHKFASQHLRSHYQNDATPRLILEMQENATAFSPDQWQRFEELWRQHHRIRGGSKVGLPTTLPAFYKAVELAFQTGSDVTPLLDYWDRSLLRHFGVPRAIQGEVVSGDRSSAETIQWIFDRYTILPISTMMEEDLTTQLAHDFDAQIRIRFEPFVSEDKEFCLKQEAQDLEKKVRTINQIRVERGLDEVDWGDEPIGTPQDVPYDPESATERINRPKVLPAPGAPADAQDAQDPMTPRGENDLHMKIRRLAQEARKVAAA